MTTFAAPRPERKARVPAALSSAATLLRAVVDELRRAQLARRRFDRLRERAPRNASCLAIARQVAREIYGERLPALSGEPN